jgi:peptidoglycan hydrolase-like protein with peptidoglycan-binding domain
MSPTVQGLDAGTAPDAALAKKMLDAIGGRWWNVYIGGPSSTAKGWSPQLLNEYVDQGIDRFMITYAGHWIHGPLTPAQARADARQALQLAAAYGYSGHFPLCIDVEMRFFESNPPVVTEYVATWCRAVAAAGARPGMYANPGPLKAMHGKVPAEFIWVASWVTNVPGPHADPRSAPGLPTSMWPAQGQRAWQYAGKLGEAKPCRVLNWDVDIDVADLECLALPPGVQHGQAPIHSIASSTSSVVRRGDSGPAVVRLTRRLSYVRSRKTGKPYLDGARTRFDGEAVRALRAFQAEHHLPHDGVFGPASARALSRSVRWEKARRARIRHGGAVPGSPVTPTHHAAPNGSPEGSPNLPALVNDLRRLEAETDRAWGALVAYGRRRRRALQEARERSVDLADVARILLRIEHEVEGLIEFEQHGAAGVPPPAAVAHTTDQPPEPVPGQPQAGATATVAPEASVTGAVGDPAGTPQPPIAPPHGKGDSLSPPPPQVHVPQKLEDLSEAELLDRIDRLEHAAERSRDVLIGRYIVVEKKIARLTHTHPVVPTPAAPGAPGVQPLPQEPPSKKPPTPTTGGGHVPAPARLGIRKLQRALNEFTARYLKKLAPLTVDGKKGPQTNTRIRQVRYYLGYGRTGAKSTVVDAALLRRMRHVGSPRFFNPAMLARSRKRRRKQHKVAMRSAQPQAGVMLFDGKQVAAWIHPYLVWAREQGWAGTIYSGYRTPEHSEEVCMGRCGHPTCVNCAGRSSNHSGRIKPQGAVDVQFPEQFGPLMQKCPLRPKLWNNLPGDRNHYSANGR